MGYDANKKKCQECGKKVECQALSDITVDMDKKITISLGNFMKATAKVAAEQGTFRHMDLLSSYAADLTHELFDEKTEEPEDAFLGFLAGILGIDRQKQTKTMAMDGTDPAKVEALMREVQAARNDEELEAIFEKYGVKEI